MVENGYFDKETLDEIRDKYFKSIKDSDVDLIWEKIDVFMKTHHNAVVVKKRDTKS